MPKFINFLVLLIPIFSLTFQVDMLVTRGWDPVYFFFAIFNGILTYIFTVDFLKER